MPRISAAQTQDNRVQIQQAALRCFLASGFSAVSVRDIAKAAGVSLGNIYTYFPDKLSVFRAVLEDQEAAFLDPQNPVIKYFLNSDFPNDLEKLAGVIRDNVSTFADYFKLIYIDVIEFDGVHIRDLFSDLDKKFNTIMGVKFRAVGSLGTDKTISPSFAMTTFYLTVYQYFLLTKVFGAKNIYGSLSDKRVVESLIELFQKGMATHAPLRR